MPVQVTEEEIQAELEAMEQAGKHHIPKSVKGPLLTGSRVRRLLIVVLFISILLCSFVWISSVRTTVEEKNGYIINILDKYEGKSNLKLAFDPTFDPAYMELVGLGYGEVTDRKGGSLLSYYGTDYTLFSKVKDFAASDELADVYEGNVGGKNFDQYYMNKYYLKNTGSETAYYRLNLKVTQNLNGALHAARFMIITEGSDGQLNYQVFATPTTGNTYIYDEFGGYYKYDESKEGLQENVAYRETETAAGPVKQYITPDGGVTDYETSAWKCTNLNIDGYGGFYHYTSCEVNDAGTVLSGEYYALAPGETTCYTIFIWFEGSDADHNNTIIGGGISFSIDYETEEYLKYLSELRKAENNQ